MTACPECGAAELRCEAQFHKLLASNTRMRPAGLCIT